MADDGVSELAKVGKPVKLFSDFVNQDLCLPFVGNVKAKLPGTFAIGEIKCGNMLISDGACRAGPHKSILITYVYLFKFDGSGPKS